jgi:hypothetical protein
MRLEEYRFTEYYHQYITIEADVLTDQLSDKIDVHEDDCYALCSCYCAADGYLEFNVLSIGPTWETCTRGLDQKEMLGTFTVDQVYQQEARIAEPDFEMIAKNVPFLEMVDQDTDEDLLTTRLDPRLDQLRDPAFPDIVLAGFTVGQTIEEYEMRITGVRGPFLIGTMEEEPPEETGAHLDDPVWAVPYIYEGECHLFILYAGENLTKDQMEQRDTIIQEMNRYGITFNGIALRN